jgi:hypothetical protein
MLPIIPYAPCNFPITYELPASSMLKNLLILRFGPGNCIIP